MMMRIAVVAAVLALSGVARADYVEDRNAAMRLVQSGKQEEALAAFVKMAAGEVSAFQKSDALDQAALCALRLKKPTEAMELAKRIPLAPMSKTCQMRILAAERKWAELAAQFKDEDFAPWPDDLKAEAAFLRGQSRSFLRDGKGAEADLEMAVQSYPGSFSKGQAALTLGDNYRDNVKDDAKAVAAYLKAYEYVRDPNSYVTCSAIISAAAVQRAQGKPDDALSTLSKIDTSKVSGYWRGAVLAAMGDTLAAQGKKADAAARFTEAAAVQGIPEGSRKDWEKRARDLQANAS